MAANHARAMAAYKAGADAGISACQWQVGQMYCHGECVDVDYKQAVSWMEKAAAQNHPFAVDKLGMMYCEGKGVTPSWRRAREYFKRAIELGNSKTTKSMANLTQNIQTVTSRRSNVHFGPSSPARNLTLPYPPASF